MPRQQAGPITGVRLIAPTPSSAPGIGPNHIYLDPYPEAAFHIQIFPPGGRDRDNERVNLDIPPDTYLFKLALVRPLRMEGYTFELVGVYPPPESALEIPWFLFSVWSLPSHLWDELRTELQQYGEVEKVVAYARRVWHEETFVCLERRWHPVRGETNTAIWPPSMPLQTVFRHLTTGCKLIQEFERRGRPRGPDGFESAEEFETVLIKLIQTANAKSLGTKQDHIATLLGPELVRRRRDTGSPASVDVDIDSTKRLIRKHISCPWPELVKKALQPR